MKTYSAYKPSGVEWLDNLPAHWDIVPVKRCYSIQLGKMLQNHAVGPDDVEVPYLKAQHVQWFSVLTSNAPKMWASPHDLSQYSVRTGDLLVCEGGEGGRCGIVIDIQPGYIIQNALHRVRETGTGRNGYLQYIMTIVSATGWFDAINSKATIAHFTKEKFDALLMPLPSIEEQSAIVDYLDHADSRIQRYISAKVRLVELLTEQKQAVINQAVTRGLDPNAPLKPSGVDWLGDVPAHWQSTTVKRQYDVQLGKMLQPQPGSPGDIKVPYLKAQHVHWNHVRTNDPQYMWASRSDIEQFGIRKGDLLVVEGGAGAANSALLKSVTDGYIIQNALHRVRPKSKTRNDFLYYLMNTVASSGWLDVIYNKATIPHFTKEKFSDLPISLPPLSEQAEIVKYLDRTTLDVDVSIDRTRRQIELMREYRTRLIADVVTGKLDVRGAVAGEIEMPTS